MSHCTSLPGPGTACLGGLGVLHHQATYPTYPAVGLCQRGTGAANSELGRTVVDIESFLPEKPNKQKTWKIFGGKHLINHSNIFLDNVLKCSIFSKMDTIRICKDNVL